MLSFGIHSFGDTLLSRVHTASQQAHGKPQIDSVRFYTHKFLPGTGYDPRLTEGAKEEKGNGRRNDETFRPASEEHLRSTLLYEYEYKS